MDDLLIFLENNTIYKTRVRANIVPKDQRYLPKGTDPSKGRCWLKSKESLRTYTVKEGKYFDACVKVLPDSWKQLCNAVTINKDLVCAPHRDRHNKTDSLILFLGDFEGGELHLENGQCFAEKGVFHQFNGQKYLHWNSPIQSGTKYSIVYYCS